MKILDGLYYTEDHEWIKIDGDKVRIGITDFAQKELGDVVYVELPEVDDELNAGDPFGVIESVKAASDVYVPLTGTVTMVNEALEEAPESINEDPYGSWIFELELADKGQLENMMSSAQYQDFLKA